MRLSRLTVLTSWMSNRNRLADETQGDVSVAQQCRCAKRQPLVEENLHRRSDGQVVDTIVDRRGGNLLTLREDVEHAFTVRRVPRTHGCPFITARSIEILSSVMVSVSSKNI